MKVQKMSAHNQTQAHKQKSKKHSPEARNSPTSDATLHPAIQRARPLIQKGDYVGTAKLLAAADRHPQVRNALGICLMRTGRIDNAVDVYRAFVLTPGTLLERADVCDMYKRNFATALLIKGLPSGALTVLKGTGEPDHPMATRLYAAIKQWERSLSWLRRLDWKFNSIEPANCTIPLGFEPGEFDFDVKIQPPFTPEKTDSNEANATASKL